MAQLALPVAPRHKGRADSILKYSDNTRSNLLNEIIVR